MNTDINKTQAFDKELKRTMNMCIQTYICGFLCLLQSEHKFAKLYV